SSCSSGSGVFHSDSAAMWWKEPTTFAQRLAPEAKVVGSFHHIAALSLWKTPDPLEHDDVLVCGDDAEAKVTVIELAAVVTGKLGVDAGALRLARQLEPLTAVLININKKYKTRSSVAITGLEGKL